MTREEVAVFAFEKLNALAEDWDYSEEITEDTLLFRQLGLESLDVVVLGIAFQDRFQRQMPFAELFAELGEKQKDLSVGELIDFVFDQVQGEKGQGAAVEVS